MKRERIQLDEVNSLPDSALTVAQYCDEQGFTSPWVYELVRKGKNKDFDMVRFKGIKGQAWEILNCGLDMSCLVTPYYIPLSYYGKD